MRKPRLLYVPFWATYLFLYAPIVVLVAMSFNSGGSPYSFDGFSLKWYGELAGNAEIRHGLVNTLIVAAGATALSTVLGTLLAVGMARHSRSKALDAIGVLPAVLPDLVLGIGLLMFYVWVKMELGLHSVLLAHAVFGTAFVAAVVRTRLAHADTSLEEASRDLGATPVTTFFRITLPQLAPGIAAGALLAFTLSVDEFVIAFFTSAPTEPTLPIVIYSMVRFGVTPEINALATVLLAVSFTVVIAAQRMTRLTESLS
ncbi:ABC transporter permease [Planomonospora sp. ID91781]|uniref:Putrescine/spermidine ABC transporter permease n=3 Tax=Planomonospora TaxID=1998 RepID=A0A161LV09_9ACTN|nr:MULTISPECIES: ABC transporter permease [Planomonospora]MBG0821333.1 ABC transporter permease [Planomonospora sp. ID91781]GAT65561.1 putrescine/spermidine ABC transporter permease [Planomonospora sphaerica]GGK75129.1 putrescine/spermidine ABC transporter permease [Planomonospora parontospora]GII09510.1 putrescine/spermidine ABC transporter permease [Planomonospora parontospora subsp. parontospora]